MDFIDDIQIQKEYNELKRQTSIVSVTEKKKKGRNTHSHKQASQIIHQGTKKS